jgi:biotin carboxyl carrier protein
MSDIVSSPHQPRRRMSTRHRVLFFVTAWLIVLMPFLFWWQTWFGRALSDRQLTEYLHDDAHPRHIQHALVQIGERMARGGAGVKQWTPRLVELASYQVDEIRNTDAWVMGQASAEPAFHQALLAMLGDPSLTVRGNAALSLVRFGDPAGRPQIVSLLLPAAVNAPVSGTVTDAAAPLTAVREGGLILKIGSGGAATEVRSPISGRVRSVPGVGQRVQAGAQVASIEPSSEQVWEALRGLYLVGGPEDLDAIRPYTRETAGVAENVRRQALETVAAIEKRASR